MNKRTFTLIELVVVIAIIAILASIVAISAMRGIDKSKVVRVASDLKAVKSACLNYRADTGVWPGLGQMKENHPLLSDPGAFGWDGPYLETPARAPSFIGYIRPGCSAPGFYYLAATVGNGGWCCDEAYGWFDLNEDGTSEIKTGLSANIFGVDVPIRRGLNSTFDGNTQDTDYTGALKVWEGTIDTSGGCPGFIVYYIGSF